MQAQQQGMEQPQEGDEAVSPEGAEQPQPDDEMAPQDEGGEEQQDEQMPPEDAQQPAPDEAEMPPQDEGGEDQQPAPEGDTADSEAVSAAPEEQGQEMPEDGNGSTEPDPQELIEALKEEGYSDQEIAYIVHGQHAPDIDESKAAKAEATRAMSEIDIQNAMKQAGLEHDHQAQSLADEREHKKRMQDLEYEHAQKKHALLDQDAAHKQRMADVEYQRAQQSDPNALEQEHKRRMLDIEYEKAKKEAMAPDGSESDIEVNKQMKQLEVEKKKLELKLRAEEMKLELEFKKREHELKLKMMEHQIKEQAKQKGEISGIKHEQRLAEAKKPPEKKKTKGGESLEKSRTVPTFDRALRDPSNRRETRIVDTPEEVRRAMLTAAYQPNAGRQNTEEDIRNMRELSINSSAQYRENGKRQLGTVPAGSTPPQNPESENYVSTGAYALGNNYAVDQQDIQFSPQQIKEFSPSGQEYLADMREAAGDARRVKSVQEHEDFHLMLNRLQQEYGMREPHRRAFAENLWNFVRHATPESGRVNEMVHFMHPQAEEHPEERPATLISFLNSPHDRKIYDKYGLRTPDSELGKEPVLGEAGRTLDIAKKMHRNMTNLTRNLTPDHIFDWMRPGHVTPDYVKDNAHLLKRVKGPAQEAPKVKPVIKSEEEDD